MNIFSYVFCKKKGKIKKRVGKKREMGIRRERILWEIVGRGEEILQKKKEILLKMRENFAKK